MAGVRFKHILQGRKKKLRRRCCQKKVRNLNLNNVPICSSESNVSRMYSGCIVTVNSYFVDIIDYSRE